MNQVLFPLLTTPISRYVSIANSDEWGIDLLEHMYNNEPDSVKSKEVFLLRMNDLYDNTVNVLSKQDAPIDNLPKQDTPMDITPQ
jgi:hypothetical protein